MRQIVYFSTAAGHQDAPTIDGILTVSRANNARDAITGMLVAGGNRYLQVIEGPPRKIGALIDAICRDDRHVGVTVLVDRHIEAANFADWSMAFFEEPDLGVCESFKELVGRMRDAVTDRRFLQQLDYFERVFAVAPVAGTPAPWTFAQR
jgi:hypothetical protein